MTSNQQPPNMFYPVANGVASSNPFVITFQTRDPTVNDVNYPIQKKWFNTTTDGEWTLVGYTSFNGILQADWRTSAATQALLEFTGGTGTTGTFPVVPNGPGEIQLSSSDSSIIITGGTNSLDYKVNGSVVGETITGDTGGALSPTAGNWNIIGQQAGTIPVMDTIGSVSTLKIEDRTSPSVFVVDAQTTAGLRGTYSTIQSAITAASAGDTVIIRPGQYNENLILKNGVNIAGFNNFGGSGARTNIIGKLIDNGGAVNCTLTNLWLTTNNDFSISLTGSGSVVLRDCRLNGANNTILSAAGTSVIEPYGCFLSLTTTGIAIYTGSSGYNFRYCTFDNTGGSTTASSCSGTVNIRNCQGNIVLATSSTGATNIENSLIDNSATNAAILTTAGTGSMVIDNCKLLSGTGSALSIGSGTTVSVYKSTIDSTNTNPVTGAGTYKSDETTYSNTGILPNTTSRSFATVGEKASWTPVLAFGGGSTGITYVAQTGSYTRIGNVVTFTCDVELSNKGSSTGNATITGLPAVGAGVPAATTIYALSATLLTFTGQVNARMPAASSSISLDSWATGGARTILTDTAFANGTFIQISGSYLV